MSTEQVLHFFMLTGAMIIGAIVLFLLVDKATDYIGKIKFKKE